MTSRKHANTLDKICTDNYPDLLICVDYYPIYRNIDQCHRGMPGTDPRQQFFHDEPIVRHPLLHDLDVSGLLYSRDIAPLAAVCYSNCLYPKLLRFLYISI